MGQAPKSWCGLHKALGWEPRQSVPGVLCWNVSPWTCPEVQPAGMERLRRERSTAGGTKTFLLLVGKMLQVPSWSGRQSGTLKGGRLGAFWRVLAYPRRGKKITKDLEKACAEPHV